MAAVKVIENRADVKLLKGDKLKDCLQAYIKWGAPIPKNITVRTPVAAIREALQVAVDSYNSGNWKPEVPDEEESTSGEEDFTPMLALVVEDENDESGWEDDS